MELLKHISMRKFHNRLLCGKTDRVDKDTGDLEGVYKDTKRRNKSYIIKQLLWIITGHTTAA